MSSIEKPVQPSPSHADHATHFHEELFNAVNRERIRKTAETGLECVGIVTLAVIGAKTHTGTRLIEAAAVAIEDVGLSAWGGAAKLARANPAVNSVRLPNGVDCTLSRGATFFNQTGDVISITDKLGNEAHLLRNGSRTVLRAGNHYFYDEAGYGLKMTTKIPELPTVTFDNTAITPTNKKLFNKLDNCLWTGHTKPLLRIPNLMEKSSQF